MCHFQAQNGPFILNKIFWYKPILLLSSTYWPFLLCKIYKKFLQLIQSCEDAPFLDPKWSICPKHFFGGKLLISFSSISPFHCPKFQKKPSSGSRVMWMCNFWTKNCPFAQMRNFFSKNLLMNLVPFIHAYLHAKNQSEILIY